jgi:hypothetical protein
MLKGVMRLQNGPNCSLFSLQIPAKATESTSFGRMLDSFNHLIDFSNPGRGASMGRRNTQLETHLVLKTKAGIAC